MSRQVIIAGAGFAGLAAVKELEFAARERRDITVRLFDRNPYTTMIPTLPDLAGGRYASNCSTAPIEALIDPAIYFHREKINAVDLQKQKVVAEKQEYPYDYLLLTAGSITDFYGFDQHLEAVHKLDFLEDAERIRDEFNAYLHTADEPVAVVVGGGYTGLELACNLQYAGRGASPSPRICVVELKDHIVPFMPAWVREYVQRQCDRLNIERITNTSVKSFDGCHAELSDGQQMKNIFLCWSTGTRFAITDIAGEPEQIRDGRLAVDEYLRLPRYPMVYAAGDAAAIRRGENYLRKAVNFSRGSGTVAGRNVARALEDDLPEPFHPVDLGWVIPFCDVGVGRLFSRYAMRGRIPLFLHYLMCGVRNYEAANRIHFWKRAIRTLFS